MTTNEMKQILVDKFEAEGCGFGWGNISLTKQPAEYENDIAVYWLVIEGYEHIKFIIHLDTDKHFGNEVWASERWYFDGEEEPESKIVAMEDSRTGSHDTLLRTVLLQIGYRIANTF